MMMDKKINTDVKITFVFSCVDTKIGFGFRKNRALNNATFIKINNQIKKLLRPK